MRSTTDLYTGKRFPWNTTVLYRGFVVPGRNTARVDRFLHPSRVPDPLLRELNEGRSYTLTDEEEREAEDVMM